MALNFCIFFSVCPPLAHRLKVEVGINVLRGQVQKKSSILSAMQNNHAEVPKLPVLPVLRVMGSGGLAG